MLQLISRYTNPAATAILLMLRSVADGNAVHLMAWCLYNAPANQTDATAQKRLVS